MDRLLLFLLPLFFLPLFLIRPSGGTDAARTLVPDRSARVTEVIDGDTVVLEDGSEVRLVGLQAPKLPLGRKGFVAWPLSEQSKAALEGLVLGETVTLSFGGTRMDRHKRHLAHLHLGDGESRRWVQGEMLRQGMARVYTFADNRAAAAEMLALEREARAARRGIWDHSFYRILDPDSAAKHIDTFQLVEGIVLAADIVKGRGYLNFGEDWRRDFTIGLSPRTIRLFKAEGIDPMSFRGRRLRVRGWLELRNGPAIEVTHPEQIELLD